MSSKTSKFCTGYKVRVRDGSGSPYKGCNGVVETVVEQESDFLYIVRFGKSGELEHNEDFIEEDLTAIGENIENIANAKTTKQMKNVIIVPDEKIRSLAYAIWEQEGRPEGKDLEHYYRAKQILEEQEAARA